MNQFYTPFGPLLMRGVLSDNVFDILLKVSNSTRYNMDQDFRNHLAGNIAEGYALKFTSSEQSTVYDEFINLAKTYMTESKIQRKIFGVAPSLQLYSIERYFSLAQLPRFLTLCDFFILIPSREETVLLPVQTEKLESSEGHITSHCASADLV